jgi:hypothetical protein
MRWSFIALSCLSLISVGSLNAQQAVPNPPAGGNLRVPNVPNVPNVQNVPRVPNQVPSRNLPAAVQQFQNNLRSRAMLRQNGVPNIGSNNRDPRQQGLPGENVQNQGNQMTDQNGSPSAGGFLDSGGSYMAGGGGGVISIEQGRLMGIADGLRGLGEFNKNTATANVLTEQAREKAIDNRYDQVQTYFQVRQLNHEYRNAARGPAPTQEDLLRYSQSAVPERLSVTALDRQSGAIHWPAALMRPEFNEHRARLEQMFQGRSYYNSGVASESYLEIQDETARMLATLQVFVRETEPTAYIQARKFIAGLAYEARFPAGHERVAVGR